MNMTYAINDIKLALGLNTIALPFKEPVENVIHRILESTLRTYSSFKPAVKDVYESLTRLGYMSEYEKNNGIYLLPPILTQNNSVISASASVYAEINESNVVTTSPFTVGSPFIGFGSYYPQDIINATLTGATINKYIGITTSPATSEWLGSNKIKLYNFPKHCIVHFTAQCYHDSNGESIEDSCRDSFMDLAILDVKRTLYNMLKNMNNVGSAFKEIQLKIDDWSGAEEAYNSLKEKYNESYLDDIEELCIFF